MRQQYVDAISLMVMIASLAVLGFYMYKLFYRPVVSVRRPSDVEREEIRERRSLRRLKEEYLAAEALNEP